MSSLRSSKLLAETCKGLRCPFQYQRLYASAAKPVVSKPSLSKPSSSSTKAPAVAKSKKPVAEAKKASTATAAAKKRSSAVAAPTRTVGPKSGVASVGAAAASTTQTTTSKLPPKATAAATATTTTQPSRPIASSPGGAAPAAPTTPTITPEQALRAAEARQSVLVAARLRRIDEQEAQAQEELKKDEYKQDYRSAARKWVSSMIALPILLVTSYYLFDRMVLGHDRKELPESVRSG